PVSGISFARCESCVAFYAGMASESNSLTGRPCRLVRSRNWFGTAGPLAGPGECAPDLADRAPERNMSCSGPKLTHAVTATKMASVRFRGRAAALTRERLSVIEGIREPSRHRASLKPQTTSRRQEAPTRWGIRL